MEQVIDTNVNVTARLACIKAAGVKGVIRYYNRNMTAKVIKAPEVNAILAAGLDLCIVHQRGGRDPAEYGRQNGVLDAQFCRTYGQQMNQPAGSAIYFAVDFDISAADLARFVVPYFQAVKAEMASGGPLPAYRVGVYGSGMTCRTLLDSGLVELTWLSQSRRFTGTPEFRASNRWNLLQLLDEPLCGINVDPDIVNPANPVYGQFNVRGPVLASAGSAHPRFRAIARNGLRVRAGPGLGFDVVGSLEFGRVVHEISRADGWSLIDMQGDGRADGSASSAFLEPV
jgi:hypothetical protein